MSEPLTSVEIAFYPEHLNHWLRFGVPRWTHVLDRRRSLALFGPGQTFGYVQWRVNDYGTQDWRFTVVQTGEASALLSRIGGVRPGGEMLLLVVGKAKVNRGLDLIDTVENAGFEAADVSPAYYRHVHNRIASRRPVRAYSKAQHEAHLAALRVAS